VRRTIKKADLKNSILKTNKRLFQMVGEIIELNLVAEIKNKLLLYIKESRNTTANRHFELAGVSWNYRFASSFR
jgi:hypothetical protein